MKTKFSTIASSEWTDREGQGGVSGDLQHDF